MDNTQMNYNLLPCPFCGGKAHIDIQGVRPGYNGAWTFITCRYCVAKPHVAGSRDTGYYDCYKTHQYIRTKTDEEASNLATEEAIKGWNTRYTGETNG